MLTPARGALRAVRSGVLAVFVLGLSAGAHLLGGGHLPGVGDVAVVSAVVVLTCLTATRWRLPTAAVTALLATSQLALHEVFMARAPSGAHTMTVTVSPTASLHPLGGGHGGGHGVGYGAAGLWLGGPSSSDAAMLLAHAAAAVALALVYSRGDDALWALCAWLAPLAELLLALAHPAAVCARPRAALAHELLPPPRRELLRSVQRRGPPPLHAS